MSRGPGKFQMQVLSTLHSYHRLGSDLGWEWPTWSRYALGNYAWDREQRYEKGYYVPVWILRRDLKCSRSQLSHALRSLDATHGLVWRFAGDLHFLGELNGTVTKYARLSPEGEEYLAKRQQQNCDVVDTYKDETRATA